MEKNSQAKKFMEIVGKENVFTDSADLYSYSYDGAVLDNQMPAVVVRPRTSEELGACVKFCNDEALKLTVRGGGTNLTGGTIPLVDGVVANVGVIVPVGIVLMGILMGVRLIPGLMSSFMKLK